MSDKERLGQLLDEQQCMVLAVSLNDGTPWATPVRIQSHDGCAVFEWDSHMQTEHSKAIAARPMMAITIFQKKETEQIGFYAKGRGELIQEFKPGFGRYRFITQECWINDETFVKRSVEF